MRLPRPLSLLVPALAVSLTACDALTGDGWVSETKESGIDGRVITVTKDFTMDGNPTMVRTVLSCNVTSKAVMISLESYEAQQTNDQHAGSPLLMQDATNAKGRVVAVALDGSRAEFALGELFTGGEYNNVVRMDAAFQAAAGWLARDAQSFWRWAAEVSPGRQGAPIDEYAASLKQAATGVGMITGLQAAFTGMNERQMFAAIIAQVVPEFVGYARSNKDLSALAPGAFVRKLLPMTVEVNNGAGAFEVTIPADNGAVNALLDECAGTPWWGATTATAPPSAPAGEGAAKVTQVEETEAAEVDPETVDASLRADLRNLVTAQEAHFADAGIYSIAITPSMGFTATPGTTVEIQTATESGFAATATHDATGRRCSVAVGLGGGKGGGKSSEDGVPQCQ